MHDTDVVPLTKKLHSTCHSDLLNLDVRPAKAHSQTLLNCTGDREYIFTNLVILPSALPAVLFLVRSLFEYSMALHVEKWSGTL